MAKKKTFTYDEDWYTVDGAETMLRSDEAAMRKEYSRLRDIAEKRLKRLQHGEYGWTKTAQKESFKKLKDIDRRDLPKALSELYKFVRAGTSTIAGQRSAQEKTTATLNKAIGDENAVNKRNYSRVIRILNGARNLKSKVLYGSDKIVELAEATMSLSDEDFEAVMDNLESILPHSDEFSEELDSYMIENGLEDYDSVDMNDFLQSTGWLPKTEPEG